MVGPPLLFDEQVNDLGVAHGYEQSRQTSGPISGVGAKVARRRIPRNEQVTQYRVFARRCRSCRFPAGSSSALAEFACLSWAHVCSAIAAALAAPLLQPPPSVHDLMHRLAAHTARVASCSPDSLFQRSGFLLVGHHDQLDSQSRQDQRQRLCAEFFDWPRTEQF
jgi:hypothetical protein